MPYSVKGLFEINEDMVQILLMFEVLFTQDSKVEHLFCGASSGSESSLFFSNYFFSLGFKPIQDDFQHDFARMTDEADSSCLPSRKTDNTRRMTRVHVNECTKYDKIQAVTPPDSIRL